MVSSLTLMPEPQPERLVPETAPHVMLGAASPLWMLFGGAAAAGATWWWWTARWREAVNLEALSGAPVEAAEPLVAEAAVVVEEALETSLVEAPAELVEPEPVALALVEDVVAEATDPEPVSEAEVEAITEAVPEPVLELAPEPVSEPGLETAALETVADDLTLLVGVGPKLSAALAELGITRFSQIAAWTSEDVESYDQLLGLKGRAERDAWVAQARRFSGETPA